MVLLTPSKSNAGPLRARMVRTAPSGNCECLDELDTHLKEDEEREAWAQGLAQRENVEREARVAAEAELARLGEALGNVLAHAEFLTPYAEEVRDRVRNALKKETT